MQGGQCESPPPPALGTRRGRKLQVQRPKTTMIKKMSIRTLALLVAAPTLLAANDLAEDASAILKQDCQMCHGAAIQQSGLDLRTREKILTGGERGAAVVGSNLQLSWLWRLVNHQTKPHMPPGSSKLSDEKIEVLRKWIMAGAPMPEGAVSDEEAERRAALSKLEERPITDEERAWWAFADPVRHPVPGDGSGNPIDAFLDASIREQGLAQNGPADGRTLVRRLYLDLTGLPPTLQQVQDFLADESAGAWTSLVDRLLESPHYGERWGRHWLDLVHYADSGGYERDFDWPTMWRYRDYVVDAFNNDKPFDLFIKEQIAGDEIAPDSQEANIATGYLRMVLDNNIKDERTRMDELDDNVATTAQAFLAVTVQCARCHNHKFDPIAQKDYYQMQAVFFSTKEIDYPLVGSDVVAEHEELNQQITSQQQPSRTVWRESKSPTATQCSKPRSTRCQSTTGLRGRPRPKSGPRRSASTPGRWRHSTSKSWSKTFWRRWTQATLPSTVTSSSRSRIWPQSGQILTRQLEPSPKTAATRSRRTSSTAETPAARGR